MFYSLTAEHSGRIKWQFVFDCILETEFYLRPDNFSAGDIILAGRLESHASWCHSYQSLSYWTVTVKHITKVKYVLKAVTLLAK